jgi:type IV pilus assembly protein PilE
MQPSNHSRGFTLIELMVVVAIATILMIVAIPTYITQVRQSRRVDARTAVLDLASREERFFSTNGSTYTAIPGSLGYTTAFPSVVGSGYYQVTVCSPAAACDPNANVPAAPSYYVTAVPTAGSSQLQDTTCQTFAVDSTGTEFAFNNAGANTTATCWSQ